LKSLLSADDAALIVEELYENMLPRCEVTFRQELNLWHPKLDARMYLDTERRYPRCWTFTASLIFAASFAEYARLLMESLYRDQYPFVRDMALRRAQGNDWFLVSVLNHREHWREVVCGLGTGLYAAGGSGSWHTRVFAVGLFFAFAQPDATRTFVDIVREDITSDHDGQVAAARTVVRRHPRSAINAL
jgi:hypothetical protein